jgi:hypothetical protein
MGVVGQARRVWSFRTYETSYETKTLTNEIGSFLNISEITMIKIKKPKMKKRQKLSFETTFIKSSLRSTWEENGSFGTNF